MRMEGPPCQPNQENNNSDNCVWITGKPNQCEVAADGSIKTKTESDPRIWELPVTIPGVGSKENQTSSDSIEAQKEEIISHLTGADEE